MDQVARPQWEQKFAALKALDSDASLKMRKPGDWYVSMTGVEVGSSASGLLTSPSAGGETPQEAVEARWDLFANLATNQYLVIDAMKDTRRHVRWNGFMWEDLPVPDAKRQAQG